MRKELMILAVVVCAVLADYLCPESGEALQCSESDPDAKFCLIREGLDFPVLVCSMCRKHYEFCKNGLRESWRPDYDCGADWRMFRCSGLNSDVPDDL